MTDLPTSPPDPPDLDWISEYLKQPIEDIVQIADDALGDLAHMQYKRGQEGWDTPQTELLKKILEEWA